MNGAKELGNWGEERAAKYLIQNGYTIIERNYSCRFGEIDIIAGKDNILAFVEVKLRKDNRFAEAREFVGISKQQKIIKTAMFWLSSHVDTRQPRFDVIEIYAPNGRLGDVSINLITDAFE